MSSPGHFRVDNHTVALLMELKRSHSALIEFVTYRSSSVGAVTDPQQDMPELVLHNPPESEDKLPCCYQVSTWRRHSIRTARSAGPLRQLLRHFCIAYSIPSILQACQWLYCSWLFCWCLPTFVLLDMSFTAAKIRVAVFGVMTPCSLVGG